MLDPHQLAAATSDKLRLRVSAGPGTGKTRMLAARVANMIETDRYRAHQIAAITYTRAMAYELKRRIGSTLPAATACGSCGGGGRALVVQLGIEVTCGRCGGTGKLATTAPTVGTLHALAIGWVRMAREGFIAGDEEIHALGWLPYDVPISVATPEDVDDLVDMAHADLRGRVGKRKLRAGLALTGAALEGWPNETEVRRLLRLRRLVTYDDLLVMLHAVLAAPAGEGTRLQDLIPCVLLDEGQDLSSWHWAIVEAWAPESLTVVGDDAQAIFGFLEHGRGTRRQLIEADDGIQTVSLGINYRSTSTIVEACTAVRQALANDGACSRLPLEAHRGEGQAVKVLLAELPLDAIVALVSDAIDRWRPEQIAVLASTWDELADIGERLREEGIEYALPVRRSRWSTIAGRGLVAMARHADCGHIDEIDASALLRALGHGDPAALAQRVMSDAHRAGVSFAAALDIDPATHVTDRWWSAQAAAKTVQDLVALATCDRAAGSGGPAFAELAAMMGQGIDDLGPAPSPRDWLLWLASDQYSATQITDGKVLLSTFHGAKGREWPVVIVAGACEGGIPVRWARTEAEIDESGRALYVGMTRARDELAIVSPTELRGKPRKITRWLA